MFNHLRSFVRRNEGGQTNIEYGVLVSLIGVALIGILLVVAGEISQDFNDLKAKLLDVL